MLQLVYISTASGAFDTTSILATSRRNNSRDDVTGLLFTDGKRFLQALEGPRLNVERTYGRIGTDPRHRALVVLSRREVNEREFGPWSMAEHAPGTDPSALLARVDALTRSASLSVQATFNSFAKLRAA